MKHVEKESWMFSENNGPRGWFAICLLALIFLVAACSHKQAQNPQTVPAQPALQPAQQTAAAPPAAATPNPAETAQNRVVQIRMHNVFIHLTESIAAQTDTLSGDLLPLGSNVMPVFDDNRSFVIRVKYARIRLTPEELSNAMNTYVFAKPDAPLKGLSVSIEGNQLRVKGRLHSKGDIPFETLGTLGTTQDGKVRVHTEKVKAFKIPIKGIMSVFGVDLANMINISKVPGIETDKGDLIMDLSKLMPPPALEGFVTGVKVEANDIVITFGADDHAPPLEKGNYISLKNNQMRFGKLIMQDTDLTVVDIDPSDPLDWNQAHYQAQLVAGYSKITPAFGLRAYVKDYDKIPHAGKER